MSTQLPTFPSEAVGCNGDCGFEARGVGVQCVAGDNCGRYIHPGDPGFDEVRRYHDEINAPDPAPLETLTLSLNYAPDRLQEAGVDPHTSEGKAQIQEVILQALTYYYDSVEHVAEHGEIPEQARDGAIIRALLSEGP